jgi:hypothetical protein
MGPKAEERSGGIAVFVVSIQTSGVLVAKATFAKVLVIGIIIGDVIWLPFSLGFLFFLF